MKNYLLNKNNSQDFILNYKIENNQIIVNIALSGKKIFPYSKEKEKELLNKMKKQVLNTDDFKNKQENIISRGYYSTLASVIVLAFNTGALVSGLHPYPLIGTLLTGIFSTNIIYNLYKMRISEKKLDDLFKNKIFLSNEKFLDKAAKSNNLVLDKDEMKKTGLSLDSDQGLTINNIHNLKLWDLEHIIVSTELKLVGGIDKVVENYHEQQDNKHVLTKTRKL